MKPLPTATPCPGSCSVPPATPSLTVADAVFGTVVALVAMFLFALLAVWVENKL